MNNRLVGNKGENIAVWYLRLHLYKIAERNYSAPTGEIDIVAKKGDTYVFVEVKYRSNKDKGLPREAVDIYKQKKIRRTAQHYLAKHNINENHTDVRFDVIEIIGKKVTHLKNAF
jgi:putative endonuclease